MNKIECDYCKSTQAYEALTLQDDNGFGSLTYHFCRKTCLLDWLLEKNMNQLEYDRKIEARLELGLDAAGYLPALREIRLPAPKVSHVYGKRGAGGSVSRTVTP